MWPRKASCPDTDPRTRSNNLGATRRACVIHLYALTHTSVSRRHRTTPRFSSTRGGLTKERQRCPQRSKMRPIRRSKTRPPLRRLLVCRVLGSDAGHRQPLQHPHHHRAPSPRLPEPFTFQAPKQPTFEAPPTTFTPPSSLEVPPPSARRGCACLEAVTSGSFRRLRAMNIAEITSTAEAGTSIRDPSLPRTSTRTWSVRSVPPRPPGRHRPRPHNPPGPRGSGRPGRRPDGHNQLPVPVLIPRRLSPYRPLHAPSARASEQCRHATRSSFATWVRSQPAFTP
jgi:hypothetical protein